MKTLNITFLLGSDTDGFKGIMYRQKLNLKTNTTTCPTLIKFNKPSKMDRNIFSK